MKEDQAFTNAEADMYYSAHEIEPNYGMDEEFDNYIKWFY